MRSQVSIEYLILLSIVILIVIPIVGIFYGYTSDSIKLYQARDAVRKIASAVRYVDYGGPGSETTVYVEFPDGINVTYVGNHTIGIKVKTMSGVEDVYEDVNPNVVGFLEILPGFRPVMVRNIENVIQIGRGFLFSPSPIYFEISRGETQIKNDTIKNLLQRNVNLAYELSGEKSSWVNVSDFPTTLNSFESKNFTINVSVPASTKSGKYVVNLIAKSNYSYEELPIIMKVIGQLKELIIKFYSDSDYTHEVNKFFPGDTVYYKIESLDEDNYPIESNISYVLTNPDSIIEKSDNRYTDIYLGSFDLSNNWGVSHGVWNLSASANRVVNVENSSTFEVKASLPIDLNFVCNKQEVYASNWWNSNWEYREKVMVSNPNSNDLTDFQVKLNVTYKYSMAYDFRDIRFVYWNGSNNKIPYWVENKSDGSWAIVWIKIPKIPANGNSTIYMYYGNPNATSESNGTAVFDFFDDFNTLDSKWYVVSGTQYSISNGILNITQGAIGLNNQLPFNLENGYALEARMRFNSYTENAYSGVLETSSSRFTAGSNANSDATILYMVNSGSGNKEVRTWIGTGSTSGYNIVSDEVVFVSQKGVWYVLGDVMNSTSASLWKDYAPIKTHSVSWAKNMSYISIGSFSGSGTYDIKDTSYDWIRIRKYVSNNPTVQFSLTEKRHITACIVDWWNSSWKYRRWINITEINGRNEVNVTVKVFLNSSNIDFSKTNGDDLRFIFNGEEIPYWIESWNQGSNATVWIKLPYLNASSTDTVWVYYGNPDATSKSNKSAVMFYDNIENGDSNWYYNGLWHVTTGRYDSPTHSFWYGNESTGDYDTGSANSGNLTTSHWIHLFDNAELNYWQYRETESSSSWDHAWVQISTDNSTWTTIDNTYNNDAGSNKTIDLSSYPNQNVLIRFYFDTVDQYYNNYEGWYIDDVYVPTYANEDIKMESDGFWWNLNWSKRVPVEINNPNSNDLTDFQVKLNVTYKYSMAYDFRDIRFVYWNGSNNKIPYWVENKSDGSWAIVWIKIPKIPANGNSTIYMYYGNPNATSESNGTAVFDFFDDFENWNGWINYSSGVVSQDNFSFEGNYSLKKSENNDPSGGYKDIGKTINRGIILEAWIFRNTSWSGGGVDRIGVIDNNGNGYGFMLAHGSTPYLGVERRNSYSGNKLNSVNINDPKGNWYFARMIVESNGTVGSYYKSNVGSDSTYSSDTNYNNFTRVYVFGGHDYWVDLMRVRKYSPKEPTSTFGAVEERMSNPVIYYDIKALDQFDNLRVGSLSYEIKHENDVYKSGNVYSSEITGNITLNSNDIGYWRIIANWTDILLSNITEFEVIR